MPDNPSSPPSSGNLNRDDILDELNIEVPPEPVDTLKKESKEKEKPEDKEEPEEPEEIKLEGAEEEPAALDDELQLPIRRQEILKKYPTIFKDFPYLEKAYYRDQQFTELFSTPDEAHGLLERAKQFDQLEQSVLSGSLEDVLKGAKEYDQNTFNKIVDNYLPTLSKVDPNAYYAVLGNVVKSTVTSMVQEAKRLGNDDLQSAALLLNQFVFGSSEFQPPVRLSNANNNPQLDQAAREIQEREQRFVHQQFTTVHEDLNGRVNNILKSTIDRHIDPKESMSDYVKKNAIKDAMSSLTETIDGDTQFRRLLDNLWKKAFEGNFSKRTIDNIRTAYLSKAKTVLPEVIKKTRAEAMKASNASRPNTDTKGPIRPGRSSTSSSTSGKSQGKDKPAIPRGTTSLDYLMED